MGEVVQAMPEDAPRLADLYAKAFRSTGFDEFAAPEKREELIAWLKPLCEAGKLWFISDDEGPVVLGHYEPEKDEVITIATRDGMERKGYAERLLKALSTKYPTAKTRPVTRGGKGLAVKCGFSPNEENGSLWTRAQS